MFVVCIAPDHPEDEKRVVTAPNPEGVIGFNCPCRKARSEDSIYRTGSELLGTSVVLLSDINQGLIDVVVVYMVDRLTAL